MRYLVSFLVFAAILLSSCTKTESKNLLVPGIPDGTYTGTFQRQVSGSGQISNVTIVFTSGKWTGQSQFEYYPALCNGNYSSTIEGGIYFENACPWLAHFDWTLILSQEYKISITGDDVEIIREYSNGIQDIYQLRRQ